MSGIAETYENLGKEAAESYCFNGYLDTYGKYLTESGNSITVLYPAERCQMQSDRVVSQKEYEKEQAIRQAEYEARRKEEQEQWELEQVKAAEAEALAIEKRQVAETLVSASDAQLIGHRAATFYRASFYEQMVSDEKRCWSNASTQEGVAKCGIYAISGIMISRLNMIYYTPDNVRARMTQEISATLAINAQAAADFIDTYIYPQADNAVKGFYL